MTFALRLLASLKLTFVLLTLVIAGVVAGYVGGLGLRPWLGGALGLLALNLLAAIATHPRFRRQGPLLAFHLCLLAAMVLVIAGDLLRLEARMELAVGQPFEPHLLQVTHQGAWYSAAALHAVAFTQGPFTVDYAPGLVRRETRSRLRLAGDSTGGREVSVGDTHPLVQDGFRFYTTSNKGLAALVSWIPERGDPQIGVVHFPSWPLHDWKQVNEWTSPAGELLVLELRPELTVPAGAAFSFASDQVPAAGALLVRHAAGEATLLAGQTLRLAAGRLHFHRVTAWMGYRVTYDPTLPWLLASGIVGALALGWHFMDTLAQRSPVHQSVGTEYDHSIHA